MEQAGPGRVHSEGGAEGGHADNELRRVGCEDGVVRWCCANGSEAMMGSCCQWRGEGAEGRERFILPSLEPIEWFCGSVHPRW